MKHFPLVPRPERAFSTLFILTVLTMAWFLFLLSVTGLFIYPLVALGLSLLGAFAGFVLIRRFLAARIEERLALVVLLGFVVAVATTTEPSVYTGRDQGTLAMAAELLAREGSFLTSAPVINTFFPLNEPGSALNFPGFAYTSDGRLIPQFPLAYPAFVGGHVLLFGLSGMAVSNGLLLFLACFIFYELLNLFTHRIVAGAGVVLFAVSFLPIWFSKMTLSENLALPLYLAACYFVLLFRSDGKYIHFVGALLSAGLFLFTRVEGLFVAAAVLALLLHAPASAHLFRTYPKKSVAAPLLGFLGVALIAVPLYLPHARVLGKAALSFSQTFSDADAGLGETATTFLALLGNFFAYGLLYPLLFALVGIVFLIRRRAWVLLIPVLLALPGFGYLLFPNITPDHPWLLRRFLFLLYPASIFITVIFLSAFLAHDFSPPLSLPRGLKRRVILALACVGLVCASLPGAWLAYSFSEHRALAPVVAELAQKLSARDLVLVDRETSGSGYALLSGPLFTHYGKQAAYIFNPADLSEIDRDTYAHIYLVAPVASAYRYEMNGNTLHERERWRVVDSRLETLNVRSRDAMRLPRPITSTTAVGLYEVR